MFALQGRRRQVAKVVVATVAGAALGLLYYWKVGCVTGTCPITSNPFLTAGLGGAFGLSLAWPEREAPKN